MKVSGEFKEGLLIRLGEFKTSRRHTKEFRDGYDYKILEGSAIVRYVAGLEPGLGERSVNYQVWEYVVNFPKHILKLQLELWISDNFPDEPVALIDKMLSMYNLIEVSDGDKRRVC